MVKESRPPIVAFFGHKTAGKSEAAGILFSLGFDQNWTICPLMEKAKDMLAELGLDERQLYGDLKEVPDFEVLGGKTPRQALETLGTQWGQEMIGADIWVRSWMRYVPTDRPLIVDDLRFPHEAKALKDIGATLVRIDRPGTAPQGLPHASERFIDQIEPDLAILNNGSLDALHDEVETLYNSITGTMTQ